jgi:hypothetical protein
MLKVVWRWCLPFIACSCYTLIAYAIIVHEMLSLNGEWRMLLAVLRWGLQIVCQALFPDDIKVLFCPLVEDACGRSRLEMLPTNSIQPLLCIDCTCHWTLCCVWMDGDSCGVRCSLPIVHRALSPDVVTLFCCCPLMEDTCGSMEMMPSYQ